MNFFKVAELDPNPVVAEEQVAPEVAPTAISEPHDTPSRPNRLDSVYLDSSQQRYRKYYRDSRKHMILHIFLEFDSPVSECFSGT